MMKNLLLFILAGGLLAAAPASVPEATGELVLNFEKIRKQKGSIEIAVFNSEDDFLEEGKAMKVVRVPVTSASVTAVIDGLPYGNYAVTSYHDVNDNNKFDRNFVGIPKEPVAVSRMYKKKLRKPRYNEAKFTLSNAQHQERMKFIKF